MDLSHVTRSHSIICSPLYPRKQLFYSNVSVMLVLLHLATLISILNHKYSALLVVSVLFNSYTIYQPYVHVQQTFTVWMLHNGSCFILTGHFAEMLTWSFVKAAPQHVANLNNCLMFILFCNIKCFNLATLYEKIVGATHNIS